MNTCGVCGHEHEGAGSVCLVLQWHADCGQTHCLKCPCLPERDPEPCEHWTGRPPKSDGLETYPEHRKVKATMDKSQAIEEFLEWLKQDHDTELCESDYTGPFPVGSRVQEFLAEYFEIDLKRLEAEKRAMLDEIRKINDKE